jgi:hypothetical protein
VGRERDPDGTEWKGGALSTGGEGGGGRNRSLQPKLHEQPIEDTVVGMIVAAGPALKVVSQLLV